MLRVKQATKQGYAEWHRGGIADLSYPTSELRRGRIQGGGNLCPTLQANAKELWYMEDEKQIIQKCGDRDKDGNYSIHDYSNTIPSNPMSDRGQMLMEKTVAIDEQNRTVRKDTVGTLTTDGSSPKHNNRVGVEVDGKIYRIRKLTPRECWRLMSFTDEDFDKAQEVNSNSQLYKEAGNSIVTNVLMAIFGQMIPGCEDKYREPISYT